MIVGTSLESRVAALEKAVQALLDGEHRNLRYINGVLCERKPYTTEYLPLVDSCHTETVQIDESADH